MVMNMNTKRESGRKAQLANISAAKAVADIIRTTLGPRSMLKMILDASGGIVLTNDGNAILREIDVSHPAAKSMIELSRTQDEEVGDGTTSVIILAGELMSAAQPFMEKQLHPTVVVKAYAKALTDAVDAIDQIAFKVDTDNHDSMMNILQSCIGTKFTNRFGSILAELALDAVQCVAVDVGGDKKEIDVKKYAKIEKVPGGQIEDSKVLKGVMFQKDVVTPGKMKRLIRNPRILLLDCPLEYKKGESQTNVEIMKEEDWSQLLKMEEEWIENQCNMIAAFKPDLVVTEKGISDFAVHHFCKMGITAVRRLRKTDNNSIARAAGATIVHRCDEIKESDIGTKAGLFEVKKIGDEYYSFVVDCEEPKACSIVLRGASKDVLNEVERNLHDAMGVAKNVVQDPRLVPGGGAVEMAVSKALCDKAASIEGVEQWPYRTVGEAMEIIPRTLAQNCGVNVIRTITKLRAKHAEDAGSAEGSSSTWGINGETGEIECMKALGIWEPYAVKVQVIKTAAESAMMLLRIDDILSGMSHKQGGGAPRKPTGTQVDENAGDNVDSERQLAE